MQQERNMQLLSRQQAYHIRTRFTNFQKQMFPEQYLNFMNRLISKFGRNPYFERRRGETVLSPKEQAIVQQALKQSGVTEATITKRI